MLSSNFSAAGIEANHVGYALVSIDKFISVSFGRKKNLIHYNCLHSEEIRDLQCIQRLPQGTLLTLSFIIKTVASDFS